jgi:hypothetical protein
MDELGHLGWVAHHSFELDGVLFGIRTDSDELARWLERSLPARLVRDEIANANYSALIGGPGKLGQRLHVLYRDSTVLVRTTDATELVAVLEADLAGLAYWRRHDAVYVQAAAVSDGDVEGLFPGEFIGLLETLRRRARSGGVPLPISRYVAVDLDTAEVAPPSAPPKIAERAVAKLARQVGSEPMTCPRVAGAPATPDLVCVIGSGESERAQPVSRASALYLLASNAVNLAEVRGAGLDALRRLVERATCWAMPALSAQGVVEGVSSLLRTVAADRAVNGRYRRERLASGGESAG